MKRIVMLGALALMAACASVRDADTAAWEGRPVSDLEKHPVFLTMQLVRTQTSDGTQIWNYVNARNVGSCSGGGSVFASTISYATYNQFTHCMSGIAACNNIFYVRSGVVEQYTPVGSGGARCFTDERLRPGFSRPTNYR
jgi:hypothetical protein